MRKLVLDGSASCSKNLDMKEGDRARIVKLSKRLRAKVVSATPMIGDVVTIQYVERDSKNRLSGYIVERIRPDGVFAWTADFMADGVEAATE